MPARCPVVFMAPDRAPTYLPPRSMQVTQDMGPLSSAAKLDALSAAIAQVGSRIPVNKRKSKVAHVKPHKAVRRLNLLRSTKRDESQVDSAPEKRLPAPAVNRGRLAKRALRLTVMPRPSCR